MLAVAGAAMVAASSTQAQVTSYSDGDILLMFRNTANITGNDLEVDLGPASGLSSDNGTVVVAASTVTSAFGAVPSSTLPIGYSAAGSVLSTDELWLTRADTTPGTQPTHVAEQQNAAAQTPIANAISAIGQGAVAGTSGPVAGSALVSGGSANSYQQQAQQNSGGQTGLINYGLNESLSSGAGGNIESINRGSTVYEALWDIPASDSSNPTETYLGYFTFLPTGQVDFTSVTAVPEPATYGLLAATGLLAVALRRQFRSLTA